MPTQVIPLSRAGAWMRNIGKVMPETAKRGLYSAGLRLVGYLKTQDTLPRDRGVYRAGWKCDREDYGAVVYNDAYHALFIEGGVRAQNVKVGRKLIDALAEWAKRKGIGTRQVGTKRTSKATVGKGKGRLKLESTTVVWRRVKPSDEVLRGIAFAIAKNFQKRGIFKPDQGGLRPLAIASNVVAPQFIRDEVAREIKREFG